MPAHLSSDCGESIGAHDILRLKGFCAVAGKPMRLVVQAVGDRVERYFDRDWRVGEGRATRLVVIAHGGHRSHGNRAGTCRSNRRSGRLTMHLLVAQRGIIQDGGEAVDLDLRPADIVVLSAADSDLASLAAAHAELGEVAPSLRLANLMQVAHPMSVDLLVANTLRRSKLVVVRLLGGESYWPYGLESLRAAAAATDLKLAALPGDARPDPELEAVSTFWMRATPAPAARISAGGRTAKRRQLPASVRACARPRRGAARTARRC